MDTYSQFVDENEALLKRLPAPKVAIEYYVRGDLFLFDEFQTSRPAYSRYVCMRSCSCPLVFFCVWVIVYVYICMCMQVAAAAVPPSLSLSHTHTTKHTTTTAAP